MRFSRTALSAMLLCALPAMSLDAQTRTVGYQCRLDASHVIDCSSDAECQARYYHHLCNDHNMTQYCTLGRGQADPNYDMRKMSATKVAMLWGMGFGIVGAVAGGVKEMDKTEEEKEADKAAGIPPAPVQYGAIGAAIGVTMGLTMKLIASNRKLPDTWWQRTEVTRSHRQGYGIRLNLRW